MNQFTFQKSLYQVLGVGSAAITLFLMTGNVTDPVNAPKFLILGCVGMSVLALTLSKSLKLRNKSSEILFLLFLTVSTVTLFTSDSPVSQNIYGVYGRNTGWLAYFFLAAIFLAASKLRIFAAFKFIIGALLFSGFINIVYNLWVLLFGDFIGWNNNYGALLGTFGNPNFISSFLGMTLAALLAVGIYGPKRIQYLLPFTIAIIIWQLVRAESLQGFVVASVGVWLVLYFWIRARFLKVWVSRAYLSLGSAVGAFGIFGALGEGPLHRIMSQPTVALREQYWVAAWNMAKSHPITGVGMDSYGDWYRRSREAKALITPGADTVTNVAHNVFLDMLTYGGFPLFFAYLAIIGAGFISIVKVMRRTRKYEPVFVAISSVWVCYQIQSLISINQLGLAVWGWVLTGLLVAYAATDDHNQSKLQIQNLKQKRAEIRTSEVISPNLVALIGGVIGLVIAVPPLNSDMSWRSVQITGQVAKLESSLTSSYLTPSNSYRLASAVELLENSQLPQIAIKYARLGVEFNPDYFDAWRMLYYATNSTLKEKADAKLNMIRLDPLNPEWKKLT